MERVSWNQAVRPSTHDLIAAINSVADDIDRIDGALDDIETDLDGKAGVSGTYPDFVAGEALSIRSGIRSNTFLSRALDTDVANGIAEVDRILGNTVVWNQLFRVRAASATINGVTFTNNGDGSITVNGTATGGDASFNFLSETKITTTYNHKYLMRGCPAGGSSTTYMLRENWWAWNAEYGNGIIITINNENRLQFQPQIRIKEGTTVENLVFKPQLFDLTQMFGAGNEPTTVAEFESLYGSDYKPYSAPTLLSSNIAGIEGADACEFPAQTLRGIGTAQDVMTSGGIERNIGIVDLSNASWSLGGTSEAGVYRMQTNIVSSLIKRPASGGTIANIRCVEYPTVSANGTYSKIKGIAVETYGSITIFDPNINTTADMHEAAQGMIVYYEVATPTTEPFAEPLDLTYRVQAGGSESWIVPDGTQSAAVTGEIGYPLDPARALITHESFADFIDKLGAYIGATITETWDGSKYTYAFASGRSALLGSIETEPDALEVTEKDDMVKEIIEDERKEQ